MTNIADPDQLASSEALSLFAEAGHCVCWGGTAQSTEWGHAEREFT